MTANQISYAKYLEDVRSNKANEAVARRQATAAERQAAAAESQASTASYNAETNRKNAATNEANSLINESAVGAQWYGAQANAAYQTAMAAVERSRQEENVRHNEAVEKETTRHNTATESNDLLSIQNRYDVDVYKIDTDVEQKGKDRTQQWVLGGADLLVKGATSLAKFALPLLGG